MKSVAGRIGLLLIWGLLGVSACDVSFAELDAISRPVPDEGGPTVVYIAMGLLDIDEINSADQNFTANLIVVARWFDPKLKHDGPGELVLPLNEVWHPELLFVNQQKIWQTLSEIVRVSPEGEVEYAQRVWGPFSQPLDLHDFPFDQQVFEVRLAAVGYEPEDVEFIADPETPSGLAPKFSLPDWHVVEWRIDYAPYKPIGQRRRVASFALVISAHRYVSHYVVKVILPLILIVIMSWIVFWIDPKESGTQIGVATTSMLTLIAYRFMIGGDIPAVPYLTRMDHLILGSTLLVFLALMQAVITSIMASNGKLEWARWVDRICRVLFPLGFMAIFLVSLILNFWAGSDTL